MYTCTQKTRCTQRAQLLLRHRASDLFVQGMLSIGAAMLGSLHVIAIDVDEDALHTAQSNCEQFEGLQVTLCQA